MNPIDLFLSMCVGCYFGALGYLGYRTWLDQQRFEQWMRDFRQWQREYKAEWAQWRAEDAAALDYSLKRWR